MPACSKRLYIVSTSGRCIGLLFSWPSAVAAWTLFYAETSTDNQPFGQAVCVGSPAPIPTMDGFVKNYVNQPANAGQTFDQKNVMQACDRWFASAPWISGTAFPTCCRTNGSPAWAPRCGRFVPGSSRLRPVLNDCFKPAAGRITDQPRWSE